jgi:inorganic pyrophosphatase
MTIRIVLLAALIPVALTAQDVGRPQDVLPAPATTRLAESLEAARRHATHVWRDTVPFNGDGSVNAYVEIPKSDRRKWEFDMQANDRDIDRIMPQDVGGYPVNYGFVPQTISYDGDPFDALVLGPPLPGGRIVRGVIVGLMLMEDEKGLDSKVVLSRVARDGRPLHDLLPRVRDDIAEYFRRYKRHEPGAFSRVPGWGSASDGLAHVRTTHAFFKECRQATPAPCRPFE